MTNSLSGMIIGRRESWDDSAQVFFWSRKRILSKKGNWGQSKNAFMIFFRTNISGILDAIAMYSAENHFREMMMSDKANSLFSFEMSNVKRLRIARILDYQISSEPKIAIFWLNELRKIDSIVFSFNNDALNEVSGNSSFLAQIKFLAHRRWLQGAEASIFFRRKPTDGGTIVSIQSQRSIIG